MTKNSTLLEVMPMAANTTANLEVSSPITWPAGDLGRQIGVGRADRKKMGSFCRGPGVQPGRWC